MQSEYEIWQTFEQVTDILRPTIKERIQEIADRHGVQPIEPPYSFIAATGGTLKNRIKAVGRNARYWPETPTLRYVGGYDLETTIQHITDELTRAMLESV
jgi:hypothetical protein